MTKTKWVTFVGEGRSGATIVSAIVDSHPNARIGEEIKVISKWRRLGWSRDEIINEVLHSGYGKERKSKALPGMLKYEEPLKIIGDKVGWDAINEVRKRGAPKSILSDFAEHMKMEVLVIHTTRNPYDNIAAWMISPKWKRLFPDDYYRARMMVRRYSRFYTTAEEIMQNQRVFHLRNEELCNNTENILHQLAEFLDLEPNKSWIKPCIKLIFKAPNKKSKQVKWNPEIYDMIKWRIIDKYPSLSYYKDEAASA